MKLPAFLQLHRRKITFGLGIALFVGTLLFYFYTNEKGVAIDESARASSQTTSVVVQGDAKVMKKSDLSAITANLQAKQIDDSTFLGLFFLASALLIGYALMSGKKSAPK
ncbi:MAG: hypothetical protein KU37_02200 [Sulfuricurvum sp. PC08-66]|nr:MAG: hypothetical protein KU37_02200 [Sulfuricurvum sp. PC08-66]